MESQNLQLPYLQAAQAQKHVTHNEALRRLDALVQLSLSSRTRATPPAAPEEGSRYLVAAAPTDEWLGHEGEIAAWQDEAWLFYAPGEGWLVWVEEESRLLVHETGLWRDVPGHQEAAPLFGVNTFADDTNRLAVKSDAVLMSHDDITPGSGSVRLKLNRKTDTDTASLLLQSSYEGRAELGLAGGDDFHLKTSQDGVNWKDSLIVESGSGKAVFPQNALTENLVFNLFQDAGRFAGSPEPTGASAPTFTAPAYLSPFNGAVFSGQARFINNNATHGGQGAALDPLVNDLIGRLKETTLTRRYGPEFWVMQIQTGTGTSSGSNVDGTDRYLFLANRSAPMWARSTRGLNLAMQSGSLSLRHQPEKYRLFVNGMEQEAHRVITPADGWIQMVFVSVLSPGEFLDYDSLMFQMHGEPGSVLSIALPFLIPAQVVPASGKLFGRVSSLEAWR